MVMIMIMISSSSIASLIIVASWLVHLVHVSWSTMRFNLRSGMFFLACFYDHRNVFQKSSDVVLLSYWPKSCHVFITRRNAATVTGWVCGEEEMEK